MVREDQNDLFLNDPNQIKQCVQDISDCKEILKYAELGAMVFYILPCLNNNDALEYISQNKFNRNCFPLWNEICLHFLNNVNIIHYVFLFDIEEACFRSSGYVTWNGSLDGIRLHEIIRVNFLFDHFVFQLKSEHRYTPNIINYVNFGEIHFKFGLDMMNFMEMFAKMLIND
ncbi:uncharacterized protein LOC129607180 [Condylostylus longicornis]|uniref:uncharacterized protein LOC129607180 n=1 Tax=Condylostylus longicornis TaxID=2530218 RepID=UPI00244E18DB|nr:uncharacterized protein LOC129607180 [Condylostylus longicornis]